MHLLQKNIVLLFKPAILVFYQNIYTIECNSCEHNSTLFPLISPV